MRRVALLALAVAFAAPAHSAAPPSPDPTPDALAVEAMHNFGACVVRYTPDGARRLLAMDFRTKAYGKAAQRLARGHAHCAPGGKMRFHQLLFAGALAEALLEKQVRDVAQRLAPNPSRAAIVARDDVETMALCTVLAAPGPTARLLVTEPASPEERSAMQALAPALGTCLAQSKQVQLNRPGLRSVVALTAWRVASAPMAQAVSR